MPRPYHKSGRRLGRIEAEMHQIRLDDAEAGWDTHNVKGVYSALCSMTIILFVFSGRIFALKRKEESMAIKTKAKIRVIIILLLSLFCLPPYIMGQRIIVKGVEKALKMPSPITIGKSLPKFPPNVPIVTPPQLLGTPVWQVTKFDPQSVNFLSLPNKDFIHDKQDFNPIFLNLRPQNSPIDPTFAPQEEELDWIDQMIKDLDLKDILDNFYFDDWEKECDDLYYALIIEKYGRAITEAAEGTKAA